MVFVAAAFLCIICLAPACSKLFLSRHCVRFLQRNRTNKMYTYFIVIFLFRHSIQTIQVWEHFLCISTFSLLLGPAYSSYFSFYELQFLLSFAQWDISPLLGFPLSQPVSNKCLDAENPDNSRAHFICFDFLMDHNHALFSNAWKIFASYIFVSFLIIHSVITVQVQVYHGLKWKYLICRARSFKICSIWNNNLKANRM